MIRTPKARQARLLVLLLALLGLYLVPWKSLMATPETGTLIWQEPLAWSLEFGDKRTLQSTSYEVNYPPACYSLNCEKQNNLEALVPCANTEATRLNTLGVRAMERVVGGISFPDSYTTKYLESALDSFTRAVVSDSNCVSALVNRALVQIKLRQIDPALEVLEIAIKLAPNSPRLLVIRGFIYDLRREDKNAKKNWDAAVALDPRIAEGRYMGIMSANDTRMSQHKDRIILVHSLRTSGESEALTDALLYVEFSPTQLSRYALLSPNEPDSFTQKRYTVLKNIIPPFLFYPFSQFYQKAIHQKVLKVGDGQSKRYYTSNDRIARFIQYQLTDLLRRVAAHNAFPSYTYFGGYVEDAVLAPHADRRQCEFTFSLTLYQNPSNVSWPLALGPKPRFEHDPDKEGGYLDLPPPEQQVEAPLYEGDALLFMGRHLVHWRVGPQPKGHETYNIFLHYVQSDFRLQLD